MDASYVLVDDRSSSTPSRLTSASHSPTEVQEPSYAHDWRKSTTGGLRISGRHFVDKYGRVCGLRGVNLSGACKTPTNDDNAIFPDRHEHVTFVGRPFSLEEAPEHFARLRRWGLTFIRFIVTWEAIEHTAPGVYDCEYLEYLKALLSLLPQFGLVAFVEMHQDVWSRYTGGSGAPAWTVAAVGFDIHKIEDAGAAWLKGVRGGGHTEDERGLWPCGYQKLAAATVATCFWAGDVFAPKLMVEGVPVQKYLQERYLKAWELLASAVGGLEGVIGFEMMNEPHRGYINVPSMHSFDYNTDLHLAHVPSPLQSFALGAGHPQNVPHYTRSFPMPTKLTSFELLNTEEINVWRTDGPTGGKCLWEIHGVWGWDKHKKEAVALRESYFEKHPMTDKMVDWYTDFYYPVLLKWAERVRAVSSADKMIFTEPIPNEFCPSSWSAKWRPSNMVFAPHWYDLNALFRKAFGEFSVNVQGLSRGMFPLKAFYWGQAGARENFSLQIRNIAEASYKALGEVPVIIGECGVPMDMNHGEAFRTNDFVWQAKTMDAMITALERSLIGYTLWNYNPDNDDKHGDYWNGENFSWFSRSRAQQKPGLEQSSSSLDEGGRLLRAVVRPYPAKTAGIPIKFDYEMNTGRFEFEWIIPSSTSSSSSTSIYPPTNVASHRLTSNETEIFLPSMLARGRKVIVRGLEASGEYHYDEAHQTLVIRARSDSPGTIHCIVVELDPPLKNEFVVNSFWSDFSGWISAGIAAWIAVLAYFYLS
ncbi:glycoside hydrolase family 5 protein [Fomitiporia mediterranea MF3/22]|uniref:glycoside hydrolase family 5 protein n=1 Tax=Fomitiporia mediterranea (strain MF3/22) TaxID=694068 RepID=UPI00044078D0|nr:glycoside hydrolase family 5 protein [Fomitiporia mediterranea MF3/22]EJD01855.1 glycoside hydrolase family 5 protein [Fomitiporia mediterranea MF3/22]